MYRTIQEPCVTRITLYSHDGLSKYKRRGIFFSFLLPCQRLKVLVIFSNHFFTPTTAIASDDKSLRLRIQGIFQLKKIARLKREWSLQLENTLERFSSGIAPLANRVNGPETLQYSLRFSHIIRTMRPLRGH